MYRIRRETGDEVTLGSLEELGTAVAAGIVTAGAEIYHARAEKWLPIASHPHFKMANDRVKAAATQKPVTPRVHASGQRPALSASGQRPAVTASREAAPQPRAARTESPAGSPAGPSGAPAVQGGLAPAAERTGPRWSPPQRAVAKAPVPKPSPAADIVPPVKPDLGIVRADALVHDSATATEPKDMEFELLPVLDEPRVIEPESAPIVPATRSDDAPVFISISDEPVEQSPAAIELVSHEDKAHDAAPQLSSSTGVEIINPDRTMPAVTDARDVSALEIPAPIRDFATDEATAPQVRKPVSRAPVMIGVALAAAAAIGLLVFKTGKHADPAPTTVATTPAPVPAPVNAAPTSGQPAGASTVPPTPEPVAAAARPVTPPSGASAGLGGDAPRKVKKSENADAKSATDGLEPPPEDVIPAAPTLGGVTDPSLTTVEAGTASSPVDRTKALEKARHEIDSSMRH